MTGSEATISTPIEYWCCIRLRVNLSLSSILAASGQSIDCQIKFDWSLTVNDSGSGVTQRAKLRQAKRSTDSGLLHKRSGPEHDLTGWLDNIPLRFAFFWDTALTVFHTVMEKRSNDILEKELHRAFYTGFHFWYRAIKKRWRLKKRRQTLCLLTNNSQSVRTVL